MSRPTGRSRAHRSRDTARAHGPATVLVVLLALVGTVVTGTAPASASWSVSGSASTTAATATLSAPVGATAPETVTADVPVTWTPGDGGVRPEGYYVVRDDGDTTAPACGSSPTSLVEGNDCTDAAVPVGEYTYVVTAVHGSWTTRSAPSETVTVPAPALLGDTRSAAGAERFAGRSEAVARARDTSGDGAAVGQDLTVEVNPPPVDLGAAASYSALAATGVVSTGATTMTGDLGVSPATSVTGFPPGTYDGSLHAGDPAAATAQADLLAALDEASSRAPHTEIAGDLGGQVFHAGVHHGAAALALTGTVTLDGEGDPGAVFVFLCDAALDTAAASSVSLINGTQPANVFWVVDGAIGTGASSSMSGALLARGAITLGADTTLTGQALSRDTVTVADSALTGIAPVPMARPVPSEEPRVESAEPETSPALPETPDVPEPTEPSAAPPEGADETAPPGDQEQQEDQEDQESVARDPADEAIHDEATVTP